MSRKTFEQFKQEIREAVELQEGGMKAALEDLMYDIPKAAHPAIMKAIEAKSSKQISAVLKKHKVKSPFSESETAEIVMDYFMDFFGPMEATAAKPKKAKPLFTNLHHPKGPAVVSKSGKTLKVHKTERAARRHATTGKK